MGSINPVSIESVRTSLSFLQLSLKINKVHCNAFQSSKGGPSSAFELYNYYAIINWIFSDYLSIVSPLNRWRQLKAALSNFYFHDKILSKELPKLKYTHGMHIGIMSSLSFQ